MERPAKELKVGGVGGGEGSFKSPAATKSQSEGGYDRILAPRQSRGTGKAGIPASFCSQKAFKTATLFKCVLCRLTSAPPPSSLAADLMLTRS